MGFVFNSDIGEYEFGAECNACTYSGHIIFIPGQTPLYVALSVDSVLKYILKQSGLAPCSWLVTIAEGDWHANWLNAGMTTARIWYRTFPGPVNHLTFDYSAAPGCQTRFPNTWEGEERSGDEGMITWGAGINEAAYLAQN